ncbi:hypothetical protein D3C87_891780 [compost metagenome]
MRAALTMRAANPQVKGGTNARLAGCLCRNPAFQAFCSARSADEAAEFIRRVCHVGSRAELDHDQQAANLFHELVRKPFAYRTAA